MRQPLDVVQDGSAGGGEAGDGLEIGVGDIRDVAADEVGQHAEKGE